MLALAVVLLFVIATAAGAWMTRNRKLPVRCCQPGAWPPDDLHEKATTDSPAA